MCVILCSPDVFKHLLCKQLSSELCVLYISTAIYTAWCSMNNLAILCLLNHDLPVVGIQCYSTLGCACHQGNEKQSDGHSPDEDTWRGVETLGLIIIDWLVQTRSNSAITKPYNYGLNDSFSIYVYCGRELSSRFKYIV
jgi:transcription elongation factor Elf1